VKRNARRIAAVLLIAIFPAPSAHAADPLFAMRQFGLLGTWTPNCTAPITDAMLLLRFTESSLGAPRMIISHPDDIIYETTIDAAALLPPDEIQLTVEAGLSPPQQIIFRRTADHLQLLTNPPSPFLQLCISE
jgi:hypothetical protein